MDFAMIPAQRRAAAALLLRRIRLIDAFAQDARHEFGDGDQRVALAQQEAAAGRGSGAFGQVTRENDLRPGAGNFCGENRRPKVASVVAVDDLNFFAANETGGAQDKRNLRAALPVSRKGTPEASMSSENSRPAGPASLTRWPSWRRPRASLTHWSSVPPPVSRRIEMEEVRSAARGARVWHGLAHSCGAGRRWKGIVQSRARNGFCRSGWFRPGAAGWLGGGCGPASGGSNDKQWHGHKRISAAGPDDKGACPGPSPPQCPSRCIPRQSH